MDTQSLTGTYDAAAKLAERKGIPPMRVLVACEYSGIVRDAFIAQGHIAMSCDILPTEQPGPHYQGRLEDVIGDGGEWDMIIAFPPCTYLCSSGIHWNSRQPERHKKSEFALAFVKMIWNRNTPKICIENPVGILSRAENLGKPMQYIQPYEFGHDASKRTCLWLKGLPPLTSTKYIEPRLIDGKPRWSNQTDGGQSRLPPSEDRGKVRSLTYQGIANAMADQWGSMEGITPIEATERLKAAGIVVCRKCGAYRQVGKDCLLCEMKGE